MSVVMNRSFKGLIPLSRLIWNRQKTQQHLCFNKDCNNNESSRFSKKYLNKEQFHKGMHHYRFPFCTFSNYVAALYKPPFISCLPESSKNNSTDACNNKLATSLSVNRMFKWKGFCFQVFVAYLEYVTRLRCSGYKNKIKWEIKTLLTFAVVSVF